MPLKILNLDQAREIANAMRSLNEIGAELHVRIRTQDGKYIHFIEQGTGEIQIFHGNILGYFAGGQVENYLNTREFTDSYNLW